MPGYTQHHLALAPKLQQIENDRQHGGWRCAPSLHLITHRGARLRYQILAKTSHHQPGHHHMLCEPDEHAEFISNVSVADTCLTTAPVAIAFSWELCHACDQANPASHTGHEPYARILAAVDLDHTHYLVMRRRSDHHIITVQVPHAGAINGIHLPQPFQALTGLLQRLQPHAATGNALHQQT